MGFLSSCFRCGLSSRVGIPHQQCFSGADIRRKRLERLRGDKAGLNAEMAAALSEGCPEWGISFGVSCLKEVSAATALDTIIFIAFARTCLTLYSLEANLGVCCWSVSSPLSLLIPPYPPLWVLHFFTGMGACDRGKPVHLLR